MPGEPEVDCEPLPVQLDPGCEEAEEEGEEPPMEEEEIDDAGPAADEPPPTFEARPPVVFFLPEWRPPRHEDGLRLRRLRRSRLGAGPAGTASESRNTSPRMCSAYWAGTPDWDTGWVNTTCTPVAVTVSSPEPDVGDVPV